MSQAKTKLFINAANPYYPNVDGAPSRVLIERDLPFDPMYNIGDQFKFVIEVAGSNDPDKEYLCEVRAKEIFTNTNTGEVIAMYNITELNR